MSRFNIFFLCSILIIGLILISGCSGIQGTSPTQTSTDTMTPIPTATATAIPTVTNTPPPPFVLTPCVFRAECPEANPLDKILESPAANGVVNQVEILTPRRFN